MLVTEFFCCMADIFIFVLTELKHQARMFPPQSCCFSTRPWTSCWRCREICESPGPDPLRVFPPPPDHLTVALSVLCEEPTLVYSRIPRRSGDPQPAFTEGEDFSPWIYTLREFLFSLLYEDKGDTRNTRKGQLLVDTFSLPPQPRSSSWRAILLRGTSLLFSFSCKSRLTAEISPTRGAGKLV